MKIHTLANGATVIVMSPGHGFKFSDGTTAEPQEKAICDKLTLKRSLQKVSEIKGMAVNEVTMRLTDEQIEFLREIAAQVDIVLVPFPVLSAMREQGLRDYHKYTIANVVAMNATTETMRSAPQDKIVDINNWSY